MPCKIKGCSGKPHNSGNFNRGFCNTHYGQFRTGLIDILGRKISRRKRPFSQDVNQYNSIVNKSFTATRKAKDVTEQIEQEKKLDNPIVKMPINEDLHVRMQDAAQSHAFLKSRKYILQNIEFIGNGTLLRMLKDEPVHEKSMKRVDEARIAKMVLDGKSKEVIMLKYGALYSENQIDNVYRHLKKEGLI